MHAQAILNIKNLTKSFGGVKAVDNIIMSIHENEMAGLIGPNGAGKTTIFNLITGIYVPDNGRIFLEDRDITGVKPHKITGLGISRTFQTIRLFKNLTALENVMSGAHNYSYSGLITSILRTRNQKKEEKMILNEAYKWLDFMNLADKSNELAKNLPYGIQRKLEIARALAARPKLLILDEPAAGLNETESNEIIKVFHKIREKGITILLIEHDMKVVMGSCSRIFVLDFGSLIAEGTPEEIQKNDKVIEAYLGQEI
ncbi:MAG: ABC transporter ATP-binding protein [Candidatus Coatesbacteria bacterium]|nr:ABC transporter ATP-binding protein [Candidatus Coatesbacteria bacterium]